MKQLVGFHLNDRTDWDKRLDRVTEYKTDKAFLSHLSTWLLELSGNVNAAQRLGVIAFRTTDLAHWLKQRDSEGISQS